MKILTQKMEFWGECPDTFMGNILRIEKAGRVCYRSEDKIIDGSGKRFVNGLMKRNHTAVIEHSNLVVKTKWLHSPRIILNNAKIAANSDHLAFIMHEGDAYIGGNYLAWHNAYLEDSFGTFPPERDNVDNLETIFNKFPNYFHVCSNEEIPIQLKRVSVHFLTDRAVTHELVRHRLCSFCQESQRYCMYKKHVEFIVPQYFSKMLGKEYTPNSIELERYSAWRNACAHTESAYIQDLKISHMLGINGKKAAEQARVHLNNQVATRIVVTASVPEWNHIFKLRTAKDAYPQFMELLAPVKTEFEQRNWII